MEQVRDLAAARMHFSMGVFAQIVNLEERAASRCFQANLSAAIAAFFPRRTDIIDQYLPINARAQLRAQIVSLAGVQAEIPEAVGREATAITGAAKGLAN